MGHLTIIDRDFIELNNLQRQLLFDEQDLAEKAVAILIKMERLWQSGDRSLAPSNRIYNMVINAYAKSHHRSAVSKAMDLLSRMKASTKCQPDNISYTSILECLSKSNDPSAPDQAQSLLQEAFDLYAKTGNPSHRPNLRTFTMAILTLAKNGGSPQDARVLLQQLLDLYKETKDPQLGRTNTRTIMS